MVGQSESFVQCEMRGEIMSDILRWNIVKTRKPHKCFGCGKTHPAKTKMVSAAYAEDGSVFGCYWCDVCVEYMHKYFESGDETGEGELFNSDPVLWEEVKESMNHD